MKWMGRLSVTEIDRGGVYVMDRWTKCQKMDLPLKQVQFIKIYWTGTRMCYSTLSISLSF